MAMTCHTVLCGGLVRLILVLTQSLEIVGVGERSVYRSRDFGEAPDFFFLPQSEDQAGHDGQRLQLSVFVVVDGEFDLVVLAEQGVMLDGNFVSLVAVVLFAYQKIGACLEGLEVFALRTNWRPMVEILRITFVSGLSPL